MVKHLKSFIESLLQPSNLKPKRVHGREITVREFLVFVEEYASIMESDEIPSPETLYAATVRATNSVIVDECIEMYWKRPWAVIQEDPPDPSSLEKLLKTMYRDVIDHFNKSKMIGNGEGISAALELLKAGISSWREFFTRIITEAYNAKLERERIAANIKAIQDEKKKTESRLRILKEENAVLRQEIRRQKAAVGVTNDELGKRARILEQERAYLMEKARAADEQPRRQEERICSIS